MNVREEPGPVTATGQSPPPIPDDESPSPSPSVLIYHTLGTFSCMIVVVVSHFFPPILCLHLYALPDRIES